MKIILGHSIFHPHTPYGRQPLTQGLSEYFFKEADKILNPSDANLKGSDNKKLGCRNLPFHRGGADKNGMSHYNAVKAYSGSE